MTGRPELLLSKLDASHAARTESVRALRAVQDEYETADRLRKQAAKTVLHLGVAKAGATQDELGVALGFKGRHGLIRLATETKPRGGYRFAGDVLTELRDLAKRYDEAVTARRALVRALRSAPAGQRLTFEEMGAAMGITGEGVRYLTRGAS